MQILLSIYYYLQPYFLLKRFSFKKIKNRNIFAQISLHKLNDEKNAIEKFKTQSIAKVSFVSSLKKLQINFWFRDRKIFLMKIFYSKFVSY